MSTTRKKLYKYSLVRIMAKMYREWYPDVTIRRAIHEALIAYELYKESETIQIDKYYDQEVKNV